MIAEIFSLQSLFTLVMLVALQAVLGFDNLLYISIESKRVEEDKQSYVRKLGIALAIILRIALLFVIYFAIRYLQDPIFDLHWRGILEASFSVHSLIVLGGGIFIIYTAFKEIHHMIAVEHIEKEGEAEKKRSLGTAIFWIVIMNLVFSFDSILSAIALTGSSHTETNKVEEAMYSNIYSPLIVMAIAVIISGVLMILLADHVANFLRKNRMYEILGLFVLFIVGVMLVTDGGHLAHMELWGSEVTKMTNTTFYFVIAILVIVDIAQGRYQKKLALQRAHETDGKAAT
jgi:predicted tellurium resistance membrane protein TerC